MEEEAWRLLHRRLSWRSYSTRTIIGTGCNNKHCQHSIDLSGFVSSLGNPKTDILCLHARRRIEGSYNLSWNISLGRLGSVAIKCYVVYLHFSFQCILTSIFGRLSSTKDKAYKVIVMITPAVKLYVRHLLSLLDRNTIFRWFVNSNILRATWIKELERN